MLDKLDEYQRLGTSEYWIVDYWAIASRAYLGYPKIVGVSAMNGQYQPQNIWLCSERIISPTFPELKSWALSDYQEASQIPENFE